MNPLLDSVFRNILRTLVYMRKTWSWKVGEKTGKKGKMLMRQRNNSFHRHEQWEFSRGIMEKLIGMKGWMVWKGRKSCITERKKESNLSTGSLRGKNWVTETGTKNCSSPFHFPCFHSETSFPFSQTSLPLISLLFPSLVLIWVTQLDISNTSQLYWSIWLLHLTKLASLTFRFYRTFILDSCPVPAICFCPHDSRKRLSNDLQPESSMSPGHSTVICSFH